MSMSNLTSFIDEEEQRLTLQTISALEDFAKTESLNDDAKVWITKKEAYLLVSFIFGLLHRMYGSDQDLPEE